MPKIEVNEDVFYNLAGRRWDLSQSGSRDAFEEALTCAKAELDEGPDLSLPPGERVLKIELNDTNRPDLWATAGCARQLRVYHGAGPIPAYPFFSRPGAPAPVKPRARLRVEKTVTQVRPFLAGFFATGKAVSDPGLRDMIQTQEKLAWNFGRKRRTVSMGIYRSSIIQWPVTYKAVDPDAVSFVPLQWDESLTLREILQKHPKGREYAFIQEHEPLHPLLVDAAGKVLSYPPIINSADLGAVLVGDTDLFVELTGTDLASITLSASIVACDLADQGFTIEPLEVEYESDTPLGRTVVTPYYFQEPVFCSLARIEKFLGEKLDAGTCVAALARMGVKAAASREAERGSEVIEEGMTAWPPEYRNDFLHAADVAEDVMIGRGLNAFTPERPRAFTVGRLTPVTLFSRRVKEIMAGMGYQEMIYNYLGSREDFIDRMRRGAGDAEQTIIRISNPMTGNYEYVRDAILPSLLQSEAVSAHAAYPHRVFETGKVAYQDPAANDGTVTRQRLGFLLADRDANFNIIAAQLRTLFYYIGREYEIEEVAAASDGADPRFIPGRAARILYQGAPVGVFGEIHPEVLEAWGVTMPCAAGELDLEALL